MHNPPCSPPRLRPRYVNNPAYLRNHYEICAEGLTTTSQFLIVYVHGPEEHLKRTTTFRQTAISGVTAGSKSQMRNGEIQGGGSEALRGAFRSEARGRWYEISGSSGLCFCPGNHEPCA